MLRRVLPAAVLPLVAGVCLVGFACWYARWIDEQIAEAFSGLGDDVDDLL